MTAINNGICYMTCKSGPIMSGLRQRLKGKDL